MSTNVSRADSRNIRPGRAQLLIDRLIRSGEMTEDDLARVLGVGPFTMSRYRKARQEMPLNHQARLALFVIANVPRFVAHGNRLRQQVAAMIAYRSRESADTAPLQATR